MKTLTVIHSANMVMLVVTPSNNGSKLLKTKTIQIINYYNIMIA